MRCRCQNLQKSMNQDISGKSYFCLKCGKFYHIKKTELIKKGLIEKAEKGLYQQEGLGS